ncbi:hypothetical protein JTB14_007011 [Gonioctena quinquepunctata]|nr:hypothetical protein JTB14_007011 [Gonioctena quinquepunctata]
MNDNKISTCGVVCLELNSHKNNMETYSKRELNNGGPLILSPLGFAKMSSRQLADMPKELGVLLALRLAILQGSLPKFSQQDNPAAFHPSVYVRFLTFCYLSSFNWWLILCPSTLSHDWQMGSIPLVFSINDSRNVLTLSFFGIVCSLAVRGLCDFENQKHAPIVLGLLLLIVPFLPATNLLVTVGFVVAERVLYIPRLVKSIANYRFCDIAIARSGRNQPKISCLRCKKTHHLKCLQLPADLEKTMTLPGMV